MDALILFLKAMVRGYRRKDGVYVKPYHRRGNKKIVVGEGQMSLFGDHDPSRDDEPKPETEPKKRDATPKIDPADAKPEQRIVLTKPIEKPKPDLGDPPVKDYRVDIDVANKRGYVRPPVGRSFTQDDRDAIVRWLRRAGFDAVHYMEKKRVVVLDQKDGFGPADIPPSPKSLERAEKARLKAEEEKRREEEKERQKEYDSSRAAYKWADEWLGDAAGDANKRYLARFLEGEDKKYKGLVNRTWLEPLTRLGITNLETKSVKEIVNEVKEKYLSQKDAKRTDDK